MFHDSGRMQSLTVVGRVPWGFPPTGLSPSNQYSPVSGQQMPTFHARHGGGGKEGVNNQVGNVVWIDGHVSNERPVYYPSYSLAPSIAICGIEFAKGEYFPRWQNNLFVSALAHQELRRLNIQDGRVIYQEVILKNAGRVRDVVSAPRRQAVRCTQQSGQGAEAGQRRRGTAPVIHVKSS